MQYVSADARADREGFMPPSRDWTRPPGTTPPTTTPAPTLPPPTDVRDSSSRLAIGFPKLRRAKEEEEEEEDSRPIIKEDSAEIALQCQ